MNEQDERVKAYYQSLSLPQSRVDQLLSHQQKSSSSSRRFEPLRYWIRAISTRLQHPLIRTSVAFAVIASIALLMHNSGSVRERADSTFKEVAMNHGTRLDLEYYGNTLAKLDDSMQQLPFTLVLPEAVQKDVNLIGARYCSLVGNLAAHVKFEDKASGKPVSLFVTGSTHELDSIKGRTNRIDGVNVELWQEGGLFYALARQG